MNGHVRQAGRFAGALLLLLTLGCRANPINLACTAIGSAVDDSYLKKLEPELLGEPPKKADEQFGRRLDTLSVVGGDTRLLVYLVAGQQAARYVVEVEGETIRALYKTERNITGAADAIQADTIKAKVAGRPPDDFPSEVELGEPAMTLHSTRAGGLIRIYDAPDQAGLGKKRYCVLEFDRADRCRDVRLVGLMAGTKSGSLSR
jgi:hypothetical protein